METCFDLMLVLIIWYTLSFYSDGIGGIVVMMEGMVVGVLWLLTVVEATKENNQLVCYLSFDKTFL